MLRIWAVIAGLYLFAAFFGPPLTTVPGAQGSAYPGPVPATAFNPAGGTPAGSGGTDPVPQIMQVYVMSPGGSGSGGAAGNAMAAQAGVESQGTAFYLRAGGQKTIVAPYHAWVMAGATTGSGQVYLAGQVKGNDGAERWWTEPARVLAADPAKDVVFLGVPPELKDVPPLEVAGGVAVGDRLHGSGYAGGMIRPNGFSADITYYGAETEVADGGEGSWKLNFQGYGLQGDGVQPGDSGSPALTKDGRVAGEVVAAGNGWILVVPATAIQQAMSGLRAA